MISCSLNAAVRNLSGNIQRLLARQGFQNRNTSTKSFKLARQQRNIRPYATEMVKWVLLVIPVTSFGLGCWQAKRLSWKLQLIETMQSQANSDPVDLPIDFAELEKLEYKPVKVKGHFIHEKEILFGPRALIDNDALSQRFGSLVSDPNKNQGYLVITPFQLSDNGDVILINRGWIPKKLKSKEARASSMIQDEVELVGVVRLNENRAPFVPKNIPEKGQWTYRDLNQLSECLGCEPVWLDVKGIPDPLEGWPIPNQTRVTLRNEHFSYLLTWFSLSGFTAFMWFKKFFKR